MEAPGELFQQTSIIVCTVDRLADLERCLASLEPFQAAGAEVVVVNNGPHGTAVEEIARRWAAKVTWDGRRGLGYARNTGIYVSRGRLLAFIDDDAKADDDWIPRLLAPFADPEVLAVVGSVWAQTVADPVSQVFDGLFRAAVPESRITIEPSSRENPFPLRQALSGNANMAIRREAFERFGHFDVRFGRGTRIDSGEEQDLFLRLLLGGGKIVVEPAARIFHRHPTEWRALRQWAFSSGCAHTAILTKYFQPSRRGAILRYAASRLRRIFVREVPPKSNFQVPRIPFLLGSLYGPLAFLLSRQKRV